MSTSTRTRKVQHGGKNFIGHFPSIKMNKMIDFESLLERDLIYLLDHDADVLDFMEQPLTIPINTSGRQLQYTPDFLVNTDVGSTLIEVKPIRFVEEFVSSFKFETARDYCKLRGWKFHVLTEHDIRRKPLLENVKLLTQFARHTANPRLDAAIISTLLNQPTGMSIKNILEVLGRFSRGEIIAGIYRLAFHHEIHLPLRFSPITLDTICAIDLSGASPNKWFSLLPNSETS